MRQCMSRVCVAGGRESCCGYMPGDVRAEPAPCVFFRSGREGPGASSHVEKIGKGRKVETPDILNYYP